MTLYSGICKGGPRNGKPMHHYDEKTVCEFKRDKRLISYTMPPEGPSGLPADIEVGAYEWDDEEKCWQWTREV